jgi:hypothetical protein
MAQLPFDWSELTRDDLTALLYSAKSEIVGKTLTPAQIQTRINRAIKPHLPIKIRKCIYPKTDFGLVYIGGVYYSDLDRKGLPPIEVNFNYNPLDCTLKITEYRFRRMARRFADTVMHEIIHMRQFRARNFKSIPGYQSTAELSKDRKEQEYYGDTDEMGAFAFNTACELLDRYGYDPVRIRKYLDSYQAKRHKSSWWFYYLKTFEWDHNHKIVKRMKNLIMRQLENAYIGKPFKTTNHLTY